MPGYPNLFTLYGPNTNGVTSIIYVLEAQTEFVRRLLDELSGAGSQAVEVKPDVHDAYNVEIQEHMTARCGRPTATTTSATPTARWSRSSPTAGRRSQTDREGPPEDSSGRLRRPPASTETRSSMRGVHHTAIVTSDVDRSRRFWCEGLGFAEMMDHTFAGDWPTLFGAETDTLLRSSSATPRLRTPASSSWSCSKAPAPRAAAGGPRLGFFLVSLERDVERTLATLAELGFADDVVAFHARTRRQVVAMAVLTAPDGVRVELIGRRVTTVVTGGASGIGAAVVIRLRRPGTTSSHGTPSGDIACNVSDPDSVRAR